MMNFSYQNKNILIIDDQKAFHVMLKAMLTNQGAENITCLDSAESAIKLARRKRFDIYLIDYNLGSGRNGSQLINYLKENKLASKMAIFFIITGDCHKEMVLTAIEKEPDDYLIKPFSQKQLFNRLKNATHKKMLLADIFDALENKDPVKAIALCKEKIEKKLKFKGLCENLLADILIQSKEYPAAEKILKKLTAERLLMRAAINLGKVYYLQKKYADAINILTEVINRSPLQVEAYQWLARTYQKSGELDDALRLLSKVANMTHNSIERHQEVALLANEMQEYKIMIASYAAILQLSRHSFYPDPCHLANYIRCIIDSAQKEDDLSERKLILKKVNSTLYQSRFEEGQNKDFDFNHFDQICQAKILITLNQSFKAKRKIMNALHNKEEPIIEFDNTILCESTFSLLEIGEFDFAEPYIDELKQREIIDPATLRAIEKHTGKALELRLFNFKKQNKLGIQAYMEKQYDSSLSHFNKALTLEPLNSSALLNRLKVYVQLLKSNSKSDNRSHLLDKCHRSFELLTDLPEEQRKHYHELKKELVTVSRVH